MIAKSSISQRMLTDKQVGEFLGISWRTVRRLSQRDPAFPRPVKFGNSTRWDRVAIENYLLRVQQQ
jgi:predicted DNA-binding transcriptional regulator AlpA